VRPPKLGQFGWEQNLLKEALETIYDYRSNALHGGRPFPAPMCDAPARLDSSWQAPAEIMLAEGVSRDGGVWRKDDIPMKLHLFEYIARGVLINWSEARTKSPGAGEATKPKP
jgi:hypothetical protein